MHQRVFVNVWKVWTAFHRNSLEGQWGVTAPARVCVRAREFTRTLVRVCTRIAFFQHSAASAHHPRLASRQLQLARTRKQTESATDGTSTN